MNDTFPFDWIKQIVSNVYTLCFGLLTTATGYFFPIKNVVHVVLFFFFVDVAFGYLAARKLRKEKFSVKIIWSYTMPRIMISIVLIILAYIWDSTFNQGFISTYNLIGWFISGVLIYSIAENGYAITQWNVFRNIKRSFADKVNGETGVNINNDK